MSDAQRKLEQELQRVAAAFAARLPERMALLASLWEAYAAGGDGAALQKELHRLRGTAASYAYATLAQQLRLAEELLKQDRREALLALMPDILARAWTQDGQLY